MVEERNEGQKKKYNYNGHMVTIESSAHACRVVYMYSSKCDDLYLTMYALRVFHTQLTRQVPLATLFPLTFAYKCTNDARSNEEMPAGSKEVTTTVSSLRIDNIASAGLNVSRRWTESC